VWQAICISEKWIQRDTTVRVFALESASLFHVFIVGIMLNNTSKYKSFQYQIRKPQFEPNIKVKSNSYKLLSSDALAQSLKRLPEIIRIKELRKLLLHINNLHIALARPHNRTAPLPILTPLRLNAQTPINLQLQQDLVLDQTATCVLPTFHALELEFLQFSLEVAELRLQTLGLDFEVAGRLGDPEFLRVQIRNSASVGGGRV
jgi:hypothetical protein